MRPGINMAHIKMKNDRIILSHGSGGKLTHRLLQELIIPSFSNPILNKMNDSAIFPLKGKAAFTTDTFVVNPLFFPGGDIGKLAVCGTVNDLAVAGAKPLYLTVSFIIEEGFEIACLKKIILSLKKAASRAEVRIAGGDLKVVEKNAVDKIFINTSGIGVIPPGVNISADNAKEQDTVIVSGHIGDHGAAIMAARADYKLKTSIRSDCAALNNLTADILKVSRNIHVMRDPTRGGVATALNEISQKSKVSIEIYENTLQIRESVRGFSEILGIDPLYMANEGCVIIFAAAKDTKKILAALKNNPLGKQAKVIGKVLKKGKDPSVLLRTAIGSTRILDMLSGEQLPRIC